MLALKDELEHRLEFPKMIMIFFKGVHAPGGTLVKFEDIKYLGHLWQVLRWYDHY